jgi:hypothetical protein
MEMRIMGFLLLLLAALADDRPPSGNERLTTPPNVISIVLRMPLLRKGMTEKEADSILGVNDCFLMATGGGSLECMESSFPIRPNYRLVLVTRADLNQQKWFLVEAKLRKR